MVAIAIDSDGDRRTGHLLLVDDDALVLGSIARDLERHYAVTTATDATDALAFLQRGERFDIIICDVVMPGLTGPELHGVLREIIPDQASRMVFTTGLRDHSRVPSGGIVLEKPIRTASLRALVASLLSRWGPATAAEP